jgi:hypothetical protein
MTRPATPDPQREHDCVVTALLYGQPEAELLARAQRLNAAALLKARESPQTPACYRTDWLNAHPRTAGRVEAVDHPDIGLPVCGDPAHQEDARRWVRELSGAEATYQPFETEH